MPPWIRDDLQKRSRQQDHKFLFARFAFVFGLFVLLACGLLALFAFAALYAPLIGANGPRLPQLALGLAVVAVLLIMALRTVGQRATRSVTMPLSEAMKAADALAAGDLTARVPVQGEGEFRRLGDSFNRMAEALEIADRQRRELLADIAHELRTPLTVIQGNLEGLRDGVYDATPDHLDLVLDETHKLRRLIDDLRILTLAEAGQLNLDCQALDPGQLLTDIKEVFAPNAQEADIALSIEAREPLPSLWGDSQRIGQVLGNLISNALRHTPAGGAITLGASVQAEHYVHLSVADTGEGIAQDALPHIFERFWQGDPARSHGAGAGSGLGLAIARSLVESQGGRIWAESQVGQGTTIWIVLPTADG